MMKLLELKDSFAGKCIAVATAFVLVFSCVNLSAFANNEAQQKAADEVTLAEPEATPEVVSDAVEAPAGEQQSSTSVASQNEATPAAVAPAGEVSVSLDLSSAYLVVSDQIIQAKTFKVPADKRFVFQVVADNGFTLDTVKAKNGITEVALESKDDGTYAVAAADVVAGLTIEVTTHQSASTDGTSATSETLTSDTTIAPTGEIAQPDLANTPAFEGYAQAGTTMVKVTAAAGVLPAGTVVEASLLENPSVVRAVTEAVKDEGKAVKEAVAIDVTLRDAEGNAIQPSAAVNVCFFDTNVGGGMIGVYRVSDDATKVETIATRQADATVQSFDVDHFSTYVVASEEVTTGEDAATHQSYTLVPGESMSIRANASFITPNKNNLWTLSSGSQSVTTTNGTGASIDGVATITTNSQTWAVSQGIASVTVYVPQGAEGSFTITCANKSGDSQVCTFDFTIAKNEVAAPSSSEEESSQAYTIATTIADVVKAVKAENSASGELAVASGLFGFFKTTSTVSLNSTGTNVAPGFTAYLKQAQGLSYIDNYMYRVYSAGDILNVTVVPIYGDKAFYTTDATGASTATKSSTDGYVYYANGETGIAAGTFRSGTFTTSTNTGNGKDPNYAYVSGSPKNAQDCATIVVAGNDEMTVGDSQEMEATVIPNSTVTWSSDNAGIAAVDETTGEVKALAEGEAMITAATATGLSAAKSVMVASETQKWSVEVGAKETLEDSLSDKWAGDHWWYIRDGGTAYVQFQSQGAQKNGTAKIKGVAPTAGNSVEVVHVFDPWFGSQQTIVHKVTVTAKTYEIEFKANGGEDAPDDVKTDTNGVVTLPTDIPSRDGYEFQGWATSRSATTATYQAGETITVTKDTTLYAVWAKAPATGVTLSGSDSVVQFGTIDLTATLTPSGSTANLTWASSDTGILTVDSNGKVTGVAQGTATVTVYASSSAGIFSASKEIRVTQPQSTGQAMFFYLKTPTSDPASNDTGQWGSTIGNGTVNTTNATWVAGKNCFNVDGRVISWPSGYENGTVPQGDHWNTIFNAFKASVEKDLGRTITKEDIQAITLVPYKISKSNGTNPDMHVDCQVRIDVKDIYTATYYLWDADGSGYIYQNAENVNSGDTTDLTAALKALPATKTIGDRTYALQGWFDNAALSGNQVAFPYTVMSNVQFYAKYISDYFVNYDLDGGIWTQSTTRYEHSAGDTVHVSGTVPTKTGYTFNGWIYSETGQAIAGGDTFVMPESDVSITAQWIENEKVTLTANSSTTPYTGFEQTVSGYTGLPAGMTFSQATLDAIGSVTAAGTDAGEYANNFASDAPSVITDVNGVNYSVTYVPGTLTINRANVTVNANDKSKVYGAADPILDATVTGLVGEDTISYTTSRVAGEAVGTYAITSTGEATQGNYNVTYNPGTLTITANAEAIVINANDAVRDYNGLPLTESGFNSTGTLVEGDHIVVAMTPESTITNFGTQANTIASYQILNAAGEDVTANYSNITTNPGTLTINRANVTVNANDKSKVYGAADPILDATVTGLVGEDTISYTTSRVAGEAVGTYAITSTGEATQGNYNVTYNPGTLTITANAEAIVINANDAVRDYNGLPLTESGFNSTGTLVEGDHIVVAMTPESTITNFGTQANTIASYQILNAAGEDVTANYSNITTNPGTLTINRANVTVNANDKSKVYGAADPILDATVTGLVGEDTISYTTSRVAGEAVGTYAITSTGEATQGNYNVTYNPGTLTITANAEAIVINANDAVRDYNGLPLTESGFNSTGTLVEGDHIVVAMTPESTITNFGTQANTIASYQILNAAGEDVTANYSNITTNPGTLTINRANVTVNANDKSKVYGAADPILDATVTGLVGEDTISYTTSRVAGEAVGTYAITSTGEATQGNYNVTYNPGTLTITANAEAIVINANDAVRDYNGLPLTESGFNSTGTLVEGDHIVVAMTPESTITNFGTQANTIASYQILNAAGEDVTANYSNITTNPGTLTINRANVTVNANDKSKVYGAADPILDATVTGLVGEDTISYTTSRVAGEAVGTYAITSTGEATQGNYNVTYNPGTLTITANAEAIVINANDAVRDYNGLPLTESGFNSTGTLVEGDHIVVAMTPESTITNFGTQANTIASYQILNAAGEDVTANYSNITTNPGTLTINRANVTVNANDKSKVYGAADPILDATVTGLVGEDTISYTTSRVAGEAVGTYAITSTGEATQGNYNVTYNPGTLTITANAEAIVINANDAVRDYNGLPLTESGFNSTGTLVEGDHIVVAMTPESTITNFGTQANTIASYQILNAAGEDVTANYSNITTNPGTLTINRANVTVNANDKSKVYGAADPILDATVTGLVGEDTISYTTSRVAGEAVGTYAITSTGEATQGNYNVTYNPGTLTITANAEAIVINANDAVRDYNGLPLTESGFNSTGTLVEGDHIVVAMTPESTITNFGTQANTIASYQILNAAGEDVTANYSNITTNPGTLTINRANVTVNANDKSKVYGAADPILDATVTGLVGEDTISYTTSRVAGEAVGTYAITSTGEATQGNYNVTYNPGTLTITANAEAIVINANDAVRDYNGLPLTESGFNSTGTLVEGDHIVVAMTPESTITNFGTQANTIASYQILNAAGEDVTANYSNITTNPGTLTINRANVTVNANDKSKVYGAADPILDATVTGLVGEDTISYTTSRVAGEAVGTYAITSTGEATQGNYNVTYNPGTLTITANAEAIVINANDAVRDYNGLPLTESGFNSTGTLVEGDHIVVAMTPESTITNFGTQANTIASYQILNAAGEDVTANYSNITTNPGTLTINRANVTVNANDKSKVYGAADPILDATVTGLVGEDTISYTTSRVAGEAVGTYAITSTGEATQGNYNVTYNPGTLTITANAEAIVINANDAVRDYNGLPLTESGFNSTGTLVEGDHIVVAMTPESTITNFGTQANTIASYQILNAAGEDVTANYSNITTNPGTLTINRVAVTVTAAPATKAAGAADPAFTATVSGLVNGEPESLIVYTLTRPGAGTDEAVGTYTGAIVAAGDGAQGNYTVTYVPADFTITAGPTPPPTPPTPTDPVAAVVGPIADALEAGVAAVIPDNATPLAEQTIADDGTPLAHPWCWVHYYIILGIIISVIYYGGVMIRRRKFTADLTKYEETVINPDTDAEGKEA